MGSFPETYTVLQTNTTTNTSCPKTNKGGSKEHDLRNSGIIGRILLLMKLMTFHVKVRREIMIQRSS